MNAGTVLHPDSPRSAIANPILWIGNDIEIYDRQIFLIRSGGYITEGGWRMVDATHTNKVIIVLFLSIVLTGCDTEESSGSDIKSAAGESCARTSDCEEGFSCIHNVCQKSGTAQDEDAGEQEPQLIGGQAGESCNSRADCQLGLSCINNVCTSSDKVDQEDAGAQVSTGKRGETCQTRIDCEQGLACINGTCALADFGIQSTTKECVVIECRQKEDCCTLRDEADCLFYESQCALVAEPNIYCDNYQNFCTCENHACVDNECQIACEVDDDCSVTLPFCLKETYCVECKSDDDCDEDETCSDNECTAACEDDFDCPYFYSCKSRICVETGCTTDRECIALTDNVLARCEDGECQQPCVTDLDCSNPDNYNFRACVEGYCENIGCETDEECRILMNLNSGSVNRIDAECR